MKQTKLILTKISTIFLLISVFFLLNHCGLLAASHSPKSEKKMSCHGNAQEKSGKECSQDDCCTKLKALIKETLRIDIPQINKVFLFSNYTSLESQQVLKKQPFWQDVSPPHLSFQQIFYLEAFPSHAPPR